MQEQRKFEPLDSRPVNRDDVFYLFQYLLGREPESEQTITSFFHGFQNPAEARRFIMMSDEFRNFYNHLTGSQQRQVVYTPEPALPLIKRGHTIALASIVKNEENSVEDMIKSCLPVVDYILIADTGSTDHTREVAKAVIRESRVPGVVPSIPFKDFAQARNQALDLLPKTIDWVIMLDADERLVSGDYQKLLDLTQSDAHAIRFPRYNFAVSTGEIINYPDYQHRFIRNNVDNPPRYSRPVHEIIANTVLWDTAPQDTRHYGGSSGGPHIHHLNVAKDKADEPPAKAELYAALERG